MGLPSKKFEQASLRPKIGSLAGVKLAFREIFALRRAALSDHRTIIRLGGKDVAVIPLRDLRNLERLVEQEKEEEFDRIDIEEAERILADPDEIPIPYEQIRRELGLGDLPN